MRLTLQFEGDSFEVDVERTDKGIRVECEGETRDYEGSVFDGTVELVLKGEVHRLRFTAPDTVMLDGAARRFRLAKFVPGGPVGAAAAGGPATMRASMPGRIVKILREPGAHVEKGDALFVLEAMKMQNELASPYAGRVAELLVKPGDVVEAGRVLAKIEAGAKKA